VFVLRRLLRLRWAISCSPDASPLFWTAMHEVTRVLNAIDRGDRHAASRLLPLVYDELRQLAAQKLAREPPGQTLQPTALVHEAYLRVVASGQPHASADSARWDGRSHFFAAAAEAMRRILVENARRKRRLKRGGDLVRLDFDEALLAAPKPREDLLALDEALNKLATVDKTAAELVQLRYFAGLSIPEAAEILGISRRTADRLWAYARAWLHQEIEGEGHGRKS
jgi:RNA polymerase sigma factor (TIGR02999 family)